MAATSSSQKPCVVALDAWLTPPAFAFDHDVFVIPNGTVDPDPSILARATIYMTSGTPVPEKLIIQAPHLQLVNCNGTGTDHVDHKALKARGISLCHVPAQNTDSVSEHAFALYYALRRRIIPMHDFVMEGKQWPAAKVAFTSFGAPTRVNSEETLVSDDCENLVPRLAAYAVRSICVIGYGAIGKKIESIAKALGMKVLVAEHKGAGTVRPGRTSFDNALKTSTLFFLATPGNDSTKSMIGASELAAMDPSAFVVNVGRGGVVDEHALVSALREKLIAGAATDVFQKEPAGTDDSPLLDPTIPNLIVSPHIAWYSSRTIKGTIATVKANLEAFVAGSPQNLVEL